MQYDDIAEPMPCGGFFAWPGTITPPLINGTYPKDVRCTWVIVAPQDNVIRVTFDKFALEYSTNCSSDRVEIREGVGSSLGR